MDTALLFPIGMKVDADDPKLAINADNIDKAIVVGADYRNAELRKASKDGRLRCPCIWCLAPLLLSHKNDTSYFAHKPRTAAVCPNYWAQAVDLVRISMFPAWRERLTAELKVARTEAEAAKARESELREQLEKLRTSEPVLLVPLTQEMLDHRVEIREPARVLFVIRESDLEALAPRLGLSIPPGMSTGAMPTARLESRHVH